MRWFSDFVYRPFRGCLGAAEFAMNWCHVTPIRA